MNEKLLRLFLFIAVAVIHLLLLFFIVFDVNSLKQEASELARVMKVADLDEEPPPPPPEEKEEIPMVEAIAEEMIEAEEIPVQIIVAPGTLTTPPSNINAAPSWDDYLPMHLISTPPKFDERLIAAGLIYPPIALRAGIEGRVILDLFVDRNGVVQRALVLREEPEGRGFGEAAVRAFTGISGSPASANDEPVSARFRYPVRFTIK
jgi:protein TonB